MSKRTLDVDPASLKLTFKGEWVVFKEANISKVLILWFEDRLAKKHVELENVSPENLGKTQGAAQEIKAALSFLQKECLTDDLESVIKYLEKNYGK